MSDWKAKRFWKAAGVVEAPGGFAVELDGRPVKTPAKRALVLPTRAMAEAVAAEWDAQEGVVDPGSMPVTRTANAALDKVAIQRAEVAEMLAAYADSDLLCYRADAPEALVARQAALWDPMLDWADEALGVRLEPRTGVVHRPQDPRALARVHALICAFDDFGLAALHDLISLSGSAILGLAASRDGHDAADLWELSRLDEIWQAEQWGQDDIAEAAAALKREAFLHARRMIELARAR